jgi:hypothetical protein
MKNNQKTKLWIGLIITLHVCLSFTMHAQNYSAWVQDQGHPTLKARYVAFKDSKGNNIVRMELISTVACSMQVTTSLCNLDKKDVNGWRNINVSANQLYTIDFKVMNSCTNGWWWWYQNYKAKKPVRFDDN